MGTLAFGRYTAISLQSLKVSKGNPTKGCSKAPGIDAQDEVPLPVVTVELIVESIRYTQCEGTFLKGIHYRNAFRKLCIQLKGAIKSLYPVGKCAHWPKVCA